MKETIVKVMYHIELTPANHHELMMRCCYDDGNDVLNSMIPLSDIPDWNLLEDSKHAVVYIEPKEYTINYSLTKFTDAIDTMLNTCIYPQFDEWWDEDEESYWGD